MRGKGKGEAVDKGALSHLAVSGTDLTVKVTPRARRPGVTLEDGLLRIAVTAAPEDGKANAAVAHALAHALGIAKGRLHLLRGATAREKVFRILD